MKSIIFAVAALTAATPALANTDQLALSLGVEPGEYTLSELAILKGAEGADGNEGRVYLGNIRRNADGFVNEVARDHFLREAASDDD